MKDENANIIMEGNKIFNRPILNTLLELYPNDANIYVFKTNNDVLKQRHLERNCEMKSVFLKGCKTKIRNIVEEFQEKICIHDNNNYSDQATIVETINRSM